MPFRNLIVLLAMLFTLSLIGCKNSNSPENVSLQFIDAAKHNEKEKTLALLTEKARENMKGSNQVWSNDSHSKDEPLTASETAIHDDKAEVTLRSEGDKDKKGTLKVLLRQESGQWRVYGIAVGADKEVVLTIDFEDPAGSLGGFLGEIGKGIGKAIGEGLKSAGEEINKAFKSSK